MTMNVTPAQQERFREAIQRLAGDAGLLCAMAELVAEDAPPTLDRLQKAIEAGDAEHIDRSAHALKGMLSTFETRSPVIELGEIVDAARSGSVREAASLFRDVRPAIDDLMVEVNELKA